LDRAVMRLEVVFQVLNLVGEFSVCREDLRKRTKARTTKTLIFTARSVLSTVATMIAPMLGESVRKRASAAASFF